MEIRALQEKDFSSLADLYSSFFSTHNIFKMPKNEVVKYLKEQSAKHEFLVYEDKGVLKGSICIVNFGQNYDGSHKLWKFRHFAFESEEAASHLLDEAESRVKNHSKTAKIELTIAENEKGIEIYKSKWYQKEGKLSNHYRWGEACYVFSKSFSG